MSNRRAVKIVILLLSGVSFLAQARAQEGPGTTGSVSESKPLDVRGQSRMQGLIRNEDERSEIDFVRVRKDFRPEILRTNY